MGLQQLYDNPLKMMNDDPEFFEFMINLIRGRYDKIQERAFYKWVPNTGVGMNLGSLFPS